jgi:TetR/AcrR family transcriptional repressor of mexJK operon
MTGHGEKARARRAAKAPDGKSALTLRGEAKYRQILDAARDLFLAEGFDTTSMDAIALRAGVSKATLYVHFEDKDDLLLALVDDECRRCGPQVLWTPKDGPLDLKRDLRAIGTTFLRAFFDREGLALHRLIMTCASRYPRVAEVFMKAGPDRCEAEVRAFLRAAQSQGLLNVPDIALAATQFLSLVQGKIILKWSLSLEVPSEAECTRMINGAIKVFLAAYQAK